jgi:hypothetical protein
MEAGDRPLGNGSEQRCLVVMVIGSQFGEVARAQAVVGVASAEPGDGWRRPGQEWSSQWRERSAWASARR